MRYYYLHFKDDDGAIAEAQSDYDYPANADDFNDVLIFKIKCFPQDYLANDLGWPLMSERMMAKINESIKDAKIFWKDIELHYKTEKLSYFIPVFTENIDVLNYAKSILSKNNFVVKAHVSLIKAEGYTFFNVPGSNFRLIVDEPLKSELEEIVLSGLDFSLCPAS